MIAALLDVAGEVVPWLIVLALGAWAIARARTDGNVGLLGDLRREREWRRCVRSHRRVRELHEWRDRA